jgi:hypothetical protein
MIPQKICNKCGLSKARDEFYAHHRMADGLLGKCKDCAREAAIKNRAKKLAYYQAYDRMRANEPHRVEARVAYSRTDRGREACREGSKRWVERNPEKRAAHSALNTAVRYGRVQKQPCAVCGVVEGVEAHHDDYSKPLEVQWLCPAHHGGQHKERRNLPILARDAGGTVVRDTDQEH